MKVSSTPKKNLRIKNVLWQMNFLVRAGSIVKKNALLDIGLQMSLENLVSSIMSFVLAF